MAVNGEATMHLDDDPNSMFEALSKEDSSIPRIVADWVASYRADAEDAVRELLQFFARSTGFKRQIKRKSTLQFGNQLEIRWNTLIKD